MPKFVYVFSMIAAFALHAFTAAAQNTSQRTLSQGTLSQDHDEIIVTATKMDRSVLSLPMSVTILQGKQIVGLGAGEDLAGQTAGLQAVISNGSQVTFQIRGIGAVDHQALTPGAAAVYMDGTYLATNVQASPLLFDIARAEILKGPQGALYGRNAASGAINIIPAKPGSRRGGYARISTGNLDHISVSAARDIKAGENLNLRLAGRYLSEGPMLKNIQTNALIAAPKEAGGMRDEFGLRLIGQYQTSAPWSAELAVHYSEDNGVNPAPRNDNLDVTDHQISVGDDGVQDTDNEFGGVSLTYERKIGDVNWKALTSFEAYNQHYGFDFDGSPAPFNVTSLNANLAYDRDYWQLSHESHISSQKDRWDFLAGALLSYDNFDQSYKIWCGDLDPASDLGTCRYVVAPGRTGSNPASDGIATTLISYIEQNYATAALFTNNVYQLTDKLSVDMGLRLTYARIDGQGRGIHIFDDGTRALNNRDNLGLAQGENTIEETRLSGNLALTYQQTPDRSFYASWANGFKSGGFNGEVINNAAHFSNEGLFGSETVNALEAGVKLQRPWGQVSTAMFYQFYDHPQARIFVPFPLTSGGAFTSNSLSNLDEARSFGLEGQFSWQPRDDFSLTADFTWLNTEILQDDDPAVPQNAESFDGNPLPFAPEFSVNLQAEKIWNLSKAIDFALSAGAKYQSDVYLDAEGRDDRRQDGYGVLGGKARLIFSDQISFSLWGQNLTDEDIAVSGFGFIGYNRFIAAPRRFGLSVEFAL